MDWQDGRTGKQTEEQTQRQTDRWVYEPDQHTIGQTEKWLGN